MKKSLFLSVLTALLCLVCALALTGCEEEPEAPAPEEPAHTHAGGEWVTVTPATCTEQGVQKHVCECGQSETGYIPASGHVFSTEWKSDDGYHWQTCTQNGCGEASDKTVHAYDEENICACSHPYRENGLRFELKNGTYAVTGYVGTATEVVLPSKYMGIAVTSVGNYAFAYCTGLTSVTIPESVTSIGNEAFSECIGLTSVTIPDSVTSIGDYAFIYCSGLTAITIPAGVTSIGNGVLFGCRGLTSITVASGNTKYHSAGNCVIETATGTLVLGCKSSVIPADGSVTSIGYRAFYGCYGLTSVTIPEGVTSIGDYAFRSCTGLTSVTVPASMTSIGEYAFAGCIGLTSATFSGPNGWWYARSSTDTSGTAISAADLSNKSTAATYLKSTYYDYYWKRT